MSRPNVTAAMNNARAYPEHEFDLMAEVLRLRAELDRANKGWADAERRVAEQREEYSTVVPAVDFSRVLEQRNEQEARASANWASYLRARDEAEMARDELLSTQSALAEAMAQDVNGRNLADVMRARYGREAAQWKANHEQRKAERDAAIDQRNDALKLADTLTRQLADQSDRRVSVMLGRAMASVTALVRQLDRIKGHSTHAEQGDLRLAKALLVEAGR